MPHTVNRYFSVPNTGDDVDTWGSLDVNPNMNSIDGALGGFASIALSAATTITLTLPSGASFTPGPGPSQSENALIKFSGTLTGNAVIKFTMPGNYLIHNACGSATSFYIQLSPASGGGNSIGAPPGRKCPIFFDGTDVDYANPPEVSSALDLHQNTTSLPKWMTACTVAPYLIKDGTVYNTSTYPALGAALGSTFGGNGVTTFGVPDERNRARVGVDPGGVTSRLTSGSSGINGAQLGAAGGDEGIAITQAQLPNVSPTFTGDPMGNHTHGIVTQKNIGVLGSGGTIVQTVGETGPQTGNTGAASAGTPSGSISALGNGDDHNNVQPTIVSFLPLIKT